MSNDYFLEAHFYAGGLRHRAYCRADNRPEWAPAADSVGFNDEFPLERGTTAVELRRTDSNGRRLTWLAVYYPSVDSKLGARSNHAGVGIWLNELTIVDARNLIYGLDLLSSKLAQSIDPETLETNAREFLSDKYVGAYVAPLDDYPGFGGLSFGRGKLAETRLRYLRTQGTPGSCAVLGDHVTGMLFGTAGNASGSRELIRVSAVEQATRDRGAFEEITEEEDQLSKFIKALPNMTKELVQSRKDVEDRADVLEAENVMLRKDLSDYEEMKERFRQFEEDPLSVVLGEIRSLGQKVDGLPSRLEHGRHPVPSTMHLPPIRRTPVTPQRRSDEPPPEENGFIFLGLLLLIFVIAVVVIWLLVRKLWL